MSDLIKTVLILLGWAALIKMSAVFVAYAPTVGYSPAVISGSLMVTGAWAAALTYMVIIMRANK
jgi:hypothetical protein